MIYDYVRISQSSYNNLKIIARHLGKPENLALDYIIAEVAKSLVGSNGGRITLDSTTPGEQTQTSAFNTTGVKMSRVSSNIIDGLASSGGSSKRGKMVENLIDRVAGNNSRETRRNISDAPSLRRAISQQVQRKATNPASSVLNKLMKRNGN